MSILYMFLLNKISFCTWNGITHLDNQMNFFDIFFRISFHWKKSECICQTKQFFYIFFFKKYTQIQ